MKLSERMLKLLFLLVCIPVRIALAVVIGVVLPNAARWTTILAGVLFLVQATTYAVFVLGIRYREKSSFGGEAFWAAARPVMIFLAIMTSVLLFVGTRESVRSAGIIQGTDIVVGISLFLKHNNLRLVHTPSDTAV